MFDLKQVRKSKEYKEGWDEYEIHGRTGKWPTSNKGINPHGSHDLNKDPDLKTPSGRWLAGANSAYGTRLWAEKIPKNTPPLPNRPEPVQLQLFSI